MSNPKKTSPKKPVASRSLATSAAAELRSLTALQAASAHARALPDFVLASSPAPPPSAKLLFGLAPPPPARSAPMPSPPPPAVSPSERRERIARAAYRRAEQRGPGPSDPLQDWLAAEREVDALLAARSR